MYSSNCEILRKQILNVMHDVVNDNINILWFGETT